MPPRSGTPLQPTLPSQPTAADVVGESRPVHHFDPASEPLEPSASEFGSTPIDGASVAAAASSSGEPAADGAPPPETVAPDVLSFELVDEDGEPVPDEPYLATLPDGSLREGRTDAAGRVEIQCPSAGPCLVQFPKIDATEWRRA